MRRPRFVPVSTYRLQVYGGFTLEAARDVVPYLRRLGIGAVYTSPYFAAEPGSTHGYDVTNHNVINSEVGGAEAHTAFTDAVRDAGMQHVVNFVPNHMGISTATNPWWRDVLANGPDAPSSHFFDIDWYPFKTELRRKLLLPILGDQYGQVLERGELQLEFGDHQLTLKYFDHHLPINTRAVPELQSLGEMTEEERERVLARYRGVPGDPRSFDALHELLEAQAYGSRTGARRPTRSTTAGSSTSTRWPACAWRTPPSSRRSTGCWRGCSASSASRGCGSIIPTGCSIRRATSRCCRTWRPRRGTRRGRPARCPCMSSPKKSCRAASTSRHDGPSTGRPGTTSPTR
jgi:hypothetical protein